LEELELPFNEDLNGDHTIGPTTVAIGTNGALAEIANQYALENNGTFVAWLSYGGGVVTAGEFGAGVTPVGAKQTGSGFEVVWSIGSGDFVVWNSDANGNDISSATGAVAGTSATLEALEVNFGETFAGGGSVGGVSSTTIATNGTTSLVQVGNLYELNPGSSGTGPLLEYQGAAVTAGEFGSGVAPVGALKTGAGYEVVWSIGSGEYTAWNTDSNGNYTGTAVGVVSGTSYALEELELTFGEDLNGDHITGPTTTAIGTNGGLAEIANQYALENNGTFAAWLSYGGGVVTAGEFGAGVAPVGALKTGAGYEVVWSIGSGEYTAWNTDSNGNYLSTAVGVVSGTSYTLEQLEVTFNEDLNGDHITGLTTTAIGTNGALVEIANQYALENNGTFAAWLSYGGTPVTAGEFGAGVTPVGAKQTGSGYEVVWSIGSNEYTAWNTDSNGNDIGSVTGVVSGTSATLEALEINFGETFAGGGPIGGVSSTTIATNGTTNLVQVGNLYELNPASGGTGPLLEYQGAAVTAGEFGAGITPSGAMKTANGYEVVWSLGSNEYTVWTTDSTGNYTGVAAGVVYGQSFTLEDLEPTFGEDLNGDHRLSASLITTGPTIDLTGQTQAATINLGANTASAAGGLSASSLTFIGPQDAITLGSAANTIEYALAPGSGIETIANFISGTDELNIDLMGSSIGSLQVYSTSVGGMGAIAIASSADPSHGVVLLGVSGGLTAANLLTNHTTVIDGHALIS
jgi:hypothetical protein